MKNTQIKKSMSEQITNQKIDQRVVSGNQKTTITLQPGKNATTMQGGIEYPIMFKEVLAGEYIQNWDITNITRYLAPLVPTLDKLFFTVKAYFVPHTRVWEDAERFLAGKESLQNVNDSIAELPKLDLNKIPNWFYSSYWYKTSLLQKYGLANSISNSISINLLLLRGYRAIENDFFIIKEYELPKTEWKDSVITNSELAAMYVNYSGGHMPADYYGVAKAKARDSYLTNVKKTMGSLGTGSTTDITEHLDWENRYNDAKQRIDNAEKNDWDIIAELGGTQPVRADRVEFLGKIDYEMNYQQVAQNSSNANEPTPLGTTGSFSYTMGNGTLFSHKKFNQAGFIHIVANVNMETVIENSVPKELLKTKVDEIYRPGLAEKEIQLLYDAEINNEQALMNGSAYQPPYAEYKRLPSFASGEMLSNILQPLEVELGGVPAALTYNSVSNAHWHNMFANVETTMEADLLRPAYYVNRVLARNNVLETLLHDDGEFYEVLNNLGIYFEVDPIINISEHIVKTALPINSSTINQTEKADKPR